MDILRMLEELEQMIEQPRGFGPIIWGLDREGMVMHISKIRASLPGEVKQAHNLTREAERVLGGARGEARATQEAAMRESERITAEARAEADRILAEARTQQDRMLAENEILRLAKAQSDEVRSSADRESLAMRRGAEDYAYQVLNQLEMVVTKVMTTIDRGKNEIRPDLLPESAVVSLRERENVRAGS